jgi:hypothetical protein
VANFYKKKKLFVTHPFLLALCRRPYPSPSDLLQHGFRPCGPCGQCGQCGPSVPSRMATQAEGMRSTWCGQCGPFIFSSPHGPHFLLRQSFPFCVDMSAWAFVDNVDHLDHRFKSARDEVSTWPYMNTYTNLTSLYLILFIVNSLSTLSTILCRPRRC